MCSNDGHVSSSSSSLPPWIVRDAAASPNEVVSAPLYYALCPQGVEDVVMCEMERVAAPRTEVVWCSTPPPKRFMPPVHPTPRKGGKLHCMEEEMEHHNVICSAAQTQRWLPPGALFFTLCSAADNRSPACIEDAEAFLDAAGRHVRSVESLLLHLLSCRCADSPDELVEPLKQATGKIHRAVIEHLGALRAVAGTRAHTLSGYNGSWFQTPFTDSTVVFRVNCVRRDSGTSCPFKSEQLASCVGEVLFDTFSPLGWHVNMLYHNVEFFALHHADYLHLGVTLTPPALPRCGAEMCFTDQMWMELLRQRIGSNLMQTGFAGEGFRAAIPRPGAIRHELRILKGGNAMNPALAFALCRYAHVQPGMVVLDPFVGSGTLLVEAWIAAGFGPLVTMGGDLHRGDAVQSLRNMQHDLLFMAAVNGLLPLDRPEWEGGDTAALCRSLLEAIGRRVEATPLGSLQNSSCKSLSRVASSEVTGVAERLRETLRKYCKLVPQTLHWDATRLPLRSNSVDCVISDLPFGRRCGNHNINTKLYPMLLRECHRVLRVDSRPVKGTHSPQNIEWWCTSQDADIGGRAVLLTLEGKLMLKSLHHIRNEHPFKLLHPPFAVEVGGLYPYVFVLEKE